MRVGSVFTHLLVACLLVALAVVPSVNAEPPQQDPVTPIVCQEAFGYDDCIEGACQTFLDAAGTIDPEANAAPDCITYICWKIDQAAETLGLNLDCNTGPCQDLDAIWGVLRIQVIQPVIQLLTGIVPQPIMDLLVPILLQGPVRCDPGAPSTPGSGSCPQQHDLVFVTVGYSVNVATSSNAVFLSECFWVWSGVGGSLFVGERGDFAIGTNGCSSRVSAWENSGLGNAGITIRFC